MGGREPSARSVGGRSSIFRAPVGPPSRQSAADEHQSSENHSAEREHPECLTAGIGVACDRERHEPGEADPPASRTIPARPRLPLHDDRDW